MYDRYFSKQIVFYSICAMESQSIGGTGTISTFDGKTVMMEMEIQFSKGRVDRILVFYGNEPTQIATVS